MTFSVFKPEAKDSNLYALISFWQEKARPLEAAEKVNFR